MKAQIDHLGFWNDKFVCEFGLSKVENLAFNVVLYDKASWLKRLLVYMNIIKLSKMWIASGEIWGYSPAFIVSSLTKKFKEKFPDIHISFEIDTFDNIGQPNMGKIYFAFSFMNDADDAFFVLQSEFILKELEEEFKERI